MVCLRSKPDPRKPTSNLRPRSRATCTRYDVDQLLSDANMNPFWQITIIEFLLNVAVFAGAIIFYGPIQILAARLSGGNEYAQKEASGVLFGVATAVSLLLPVHLEGGAAIGCSTILLALIGPLDGSMAILGGLVLS